MRKFLVSAFALLTGCGSESSCCAICEPVNTSSTQGTGGLVLIACIAIPAVIVIITLALNLKYIFHPKEPRFENIKRIVLDEES
jgi:hypothetical protein